MTALILIVQVVVPVALLLWFSRWPAVTRPALALQAAGVAAFLLALAWVAQWALPVWWLPYVYLALWLAITLNRLVRGHGPRGRALPSRRWGWSSMVVSAVLLVVGGWYGGWAIAGRQLPPVDVVDVANPFGPGHYLVGHGGSNAWVNGHVRTLDASNARFRPWRGQSYAVDFFGIGPWGLRARGWHPADPAAYAIFGAPLRAPCSGQVMAALGRMPDLDVPQQDLVSRLGNHVILRCGRIEIVMAHMRQGSVRVVAGDRVTQGELLGEVGNSGASTEPHLHIHAQRPAAADAPPLSGEPLALRIDGRFLVRGDRLSGPR